MSGGSYYYNKNNTYNAADVRFKDGLLYLGIIYAVDVDKGCYLG